MRIFLTAAAFTAIGLAASISLAEEKPRAERLAEIIAPHVDAQTLLVVHTDLMAFDAPQSIDWAAKVFGLPRQQRDQMQAEVAPINVVAQSIPKGSAIDLFVVTSLSDLSRLPFFLVLPIDETTPANAIAVEVRRDLEKGWQRPVAIERIGQSLVTASPETIERLKKAPPAPRPELVAAFGAVGDAAVRVVFMPPVELRRLAEGIAPQLPKQLGGGPTKAFTEGAVWVAIGIDLPPRKVAARVVVQSTSAEAAANLQRELHRVLEAIAELPQIRDTIPNFGTLSKQLVPKAASDQSKLELTDEQVAAVAPILAPLLRSLFSAFASRP
jgi:hypothetical protein